MSSAATWVTPQSRQRSYSIDSQYSRSAFYIEKDLKTILTLRQKRISLKWFFFSDKCIIDILYLYSNLVFQKIIRTWEILPFV